MVRGGKRLAGITPAFSLFAPVHGLILDMADDEFPTRMSCAHGADLHLPSDGHHFGYVCSGETVFSHGGGTMRLAPGMYFSLPGEHDIASTGVTAVITRLGHYGLSQIGGPIEDRGRLRYIDGCTDSLLVSPTMMSDPCLNLLHFPPGINQTAHTHSSARLGVVAAGAGICRTAMGDWPLKPGALFCIPANAEHSFATEASSMSVIAYHPDSDFGPTHEEHPMISRTIVEGVPANQIDAIRTGPI